MTNEDGWKLLDQYIKLGGRPWLLSLVAAGALRYGTGQTQEEVQPLHRLYLFFVGIKPR
jgi:hypothetical protein